MGLIKDILAQTQATCLPASLTEGSKGRKAHSVGYPGPKRNNYPTPVVLPVWLVRDLWRNSHHRGGRVERVSPKTNVFD